MWFERHEVEFVHGMRGSGICLRVTIDHVCDPISYSNGPIQQCRK